MAEPLEFFQMIETDAVSQARAALDANPALLHMRDRLGRTPLHAAVARGSLTMARMLLETGAPVDSTDRQHETVLYTAASQDAALVQLLLDAGADPNQRSILNDTALFNACDHHAHETARLLLARGADVNARNDFWQTPLHAAAAGRDAQMVALLVEAGAQVDARDWLGETAMHLAVHGIVDADDAAACLQTVDALLAAGADRAAKNAAHLTVLQTARSASDGSDFVKALRQRGLQ